MYKLFVAGLLALGLGSPALAGNGSEGSGNYDLVSLQAQSSREVANDRMEATLVAEAEGIDPAALADTVNDVIRRALKTAAAFKTVDTRSGNYQTFPVYDKQRVVRWRVRHELRLSSSDFPALTRLIGQLQENMQLNALDFSVSPATRKAAENHLIAEGIAAFKERAEIVRSSLGASSYRIRDLHIDTANGAPRPVLYARAMGTATGAATPPAIEGGTSRIAVTVSGTVQMR